MLSENKIAIIGTGNMGSALAQGLVRSGVLSGSNLFLYDSLLDKAELLAERIGGADRPNVISALYPDLCPVKNIDIIILAVKPYIVPDIVKEIGPNLGDCPLIVSIAAGVTIESIERLILDFPVPVIRVMPNTPALVGAGAAAFALGKYATEEHAGLVSEILGAVGTSVRVDEKLIDAVTGCPVPGRRMFTW
jgi:pyrroline-5-carboxylate reductase